MSDEISALFLNIVEPLIQAFTDGDTAHFEEMVDTLDDDMLEIVVMGLYVFEGRAVHDGDRMQAYFMNDISLGVLRRVLRRNSGHWAPILARSLGNAGAVRFSLGYDEEALAAAQEAVEFYRTLHQTQPEAFAADLAMCLNNLASFLADLGSHENALTASQESVAIRRTLYATRPEAFASDLAASLNNLTDVLSALGYNEEALAAGQEAVKLYRTLHEARPEAFASDLAMGLTHFAKCMSCVGRYEEAVVALQEVVELNRSLYDEYPDVFANDLVKSLDYLAGELLRLGRPEEVLAAVQEAVPLYSILYEESPDAWASDFFKKVSLLAKLLSDSGWHEEALATVQKAVGIFRDLPEEILETCASDVAMSLNCLAGVLSGYGHHEEALGAAQAAVLIFRRLPDKILDAYTSKVAASVKNLAIYLSKSGRYEAAIRSAQEAVTLYRLMYNENVSVFANDLADSLNNLAAFLSDLDCHEEALVAVHEAVEIRRKLSVEAPDTHARDLASSLNSLALELSALCRYEEALLAARESVTTVRKLYDKDAGAVAITKELALHLNNLGTLLAHLGRDDEALGAMQEAVAIFRTFSVVMPHTVTNDLAMSLHNQAILLDNLSRHEEALAAAQEAVTIRRPLYDSAPNVIANDFAKLLKTLAFMLFDVGRREEALKAAEEAVELAFPRLLMKLRTSGNFDRNQAIMHKALSYKSYLGMAIPAAVHDPTIGARALIAVWRHCSLLRDLDSILTASIHGNRHPELKGDLELWQHAETEYAVALRAGPGGDIDAWSRNLQRFAGEIEERRRFLSARIPEMRLEDSLREVTVERVAATLPAGHALIEIVYYQAIYLEKREFADWHCAAFILPAGRADAVQVVDLGPVEPIESAVAGFRFAVAGAPLEELEDIKKALIRGRPPATGASARPELLRDIGAHLRQMVFDPIAEKLPDGVETLVLAPDGPLALLPFDALPIYGVDGNPGWLIDRYAFVYLDSGRDVLRWTWEHGETRSATGPALVVAAPDYDAAADGQRVRLEKPPFPPLAHTGPEGEVVAATLQVAPLTAEPATLLAFVTALNRETPRVLHLATHGAYVTGTVHAAMAGSRSSVMEPLMTTDFVGCNNVAPDVTDLPDDPLLCSRLALTGANAPAAGLTAPDGSDGCLSGRDVLRLPLRGCELVTLSACVSLVGKVDIGQGVRGLRYAFIQAGARAVLGSLFNVDDARTATLMTDFYGAIFGPERKGRLRALHDVQLALRRQHPDDPRLWASFILVGDPGPIIG